MNDTFAVTSAATRLWLLIRSDFLCSTRSLMITSGAFALLIFITSMIAGDVSFGFYNSWFGFLLFVYGIHLTSKAFSALHDKTRNQAYLLVPASSVEKTLAELFKVTIGFVIYLLIFVTCVSFLTELAKLLFQGARNDSFDPFRPYIWTLISNYLFLQSFFFLGAAWFNRHPLVKTLLALCLVVLGLMLIYWMSSKIFYGGFIEHLGMARLQGKPVLEGLDVILPLCCWSIAWLRVREAQVSNGV